MTIALPTAKLTIDESAAGLVAKNADAIVAFFGCCSKGTTILSYEYGRPKSLSAARGCGPGVKAAAYCMGKTGTPIVFARLPAVAVAAFTSAVDKSGITVGTLVPTVTGTALDSFDVKIVFTVGGTIGVSGISIKFSINGGATFTSPAALGTATTFALTGTGLTLNFTATQTVVTAEYCALWTLPASQTVLPVATARVGTSTSVVTATGAPEDAYDVVFEFPVGGTRGTTGIVYRYSLDGGRKWSPLYQLSTATSVDLLDGAEASGITVSIGAGTLDAGDSFTFGTTAPQWQASDAVLALQALRESAHDWGFSVFVGDSSSSVAGSIGGELAAEASAVGGPKYSFGLLSARDWGTRETDDNWESRLLADYLSFASSRVSVSAGEARITCPITGRRQRRAASWIVAPWLVLFGTEVDPGRKQSGALFADVEIHDADNQLVELDARFSPELHNARFITLRTYADQPGVYVTLGNLMSADGSAITLVPQRRVIDEVARVQRIVEQEQLVSGVFQNLAFQANPGAIRPVDASRIEREVKSAVSNSIRGKVSSYDYALDKTTPIGTGTLNGSGSVTFLQYITEIDSTVSVVQPGAVAV